jgi:hypothetical protein
LAIALWVSNRGVTDFYAKIFTIPLECAAGELGPVVSDDPVWDPKPVDDGLDKLDYGLLIDLDHMDHLWSLGEIIYGDIERAVPSDSPGKWSQDVQPPNSEWRDHLQHLRQCVDLLGMELTCAVGLYEQDNILGL